MFATLHRYCSAKVCFFSQKQEFFKTFFGKKLKNSIYDKKQAKKKMRN